MNPAAFEHDLGVALDSDFSGGDTSVDGALVHGYYEETNETDPGDGSIASARQVRYITRRSLSLGVHLVRVGLSDGSHIEYEIIADEGTYGAHRYLLRKVETNA